MSEIIPDRDYRISSACGISGIINRSGKTFCGDAIASSICKMKERGNGLGAGFAAYGIYPSLEKFWCFHIMCETEKALAETEEYLKKNFRIVFSEPIPTRKSKTILFSPILRRYFLEVSPRSKVRFHRGTSDEDFVVETTMFINSSIEDAFVFSSGKNMGIFKGVGEPDEIAEFYRIDEYRANIWTAHNRFPTNTSGWWGGAHPFGILDWSVVHNGEISSYGINRRYLENFGYFCSLFTDTEVITYLLDLLVRCHKIPLENIGFIFSSPFWEKIEKNNRRKKFFEKLRIVYASALLNGPFAIIAARNNFMFALNDRLKLRPLVAAEKNEFLYVASEEAAIRVVCKNPERLWMPEAGVPVIGKING